MSILSKSRTVLDFIGAEGGEATFATKEPEPSATHLRRIEVPRQMWEDLGKPDHITITVEAGNLLKDGDDND